MAKPDITAQERKDDIQVAKGSGTTLQPHEEQHLRRKGPFDLFDDMRREMAQIRAQLTPFMGGSPFPAPSVWSQTGSVWEPRVDVYEKGDHLVVKAELPGVKKEDIEVELEQESLIIRGQRHEEHEVREEQFYRSERSYGSFYRRLPVPEGVRAEDIHASFADGVLEVRMPKPKEAESKRLKIDVK